MPYTRISLTIPSSLLKELDKHAKSNEKARSRVVAEAVREYLKNAPVSTPQAARVAEEAPAPYYAGFAHARLDLLKHNLALTAGERLRQAENLLGLAPRRPRRHQVLAFDSYDDYYEWKKTRNVR